MSKLLLVVLSWPLLAGLYLVLAGTADTVEIACAVGTASLGTGLALATAFVGERRFTLALPARAILRPLASLLPDFIAVGRVLLAGGRGERGGFVRQPFRPGDADGRSAMRRALTVIGVSLAPRTFVVRGEDGEELLLHCLPVKAPSPDHVWPA